MDGEGDGGGGGHPGGAPPPNIDRIQNVDPLRHLPTFV